MASIADILESKKQALIPSFYTKDKDRKPIPSIKKAFLIPLEITKAQWTKGTYTFEKIEWKIILDQRSRVDIEKDLAFEGYCKCIMSFQQHTYGNYVVCRKFENKARIQESK